MFTENVLKENEYLSKKYSKFTGAVESALKESDSSIEFDDFKKVQLSIMLENVSNAVAAYANKKVLESAGTFQVNDVPAKNQYLALTSAVMPTLVADNVASIQAMKQKAAICYYMGYVYGDNRGRITAGDTISSVFQVGPDSDKYADATKYASETINGEALLAGTDQKTGWAPVRPGSVTVDADGTGATIVTDNGDGTLSDGGTIDYATGNITLGSAATADGIINYDQDLEYAPANLPRVGVQLQEIVMNARPKALKTEFSLFGAFDLMQTQNVDIQKILSNLAVDELRAEIDGEILNDIMSVDANAAAGVSTWNIEVPFGVTKKDHYASFYLELVRAAALIKQSTRKYLGNRVIAGFNASVVIRALDNFKAAASYNNVGPSVMGTIDKDFTVIYNPYAHEDAYVVLYKGENPYDTSYVYGTYMPIVSSQFIMDSTLLGHQGYATSYGKRLVNPKYIVKGTITHLVG